MITQFKNEYSFLSNFQLFEKPMDITSKRLVFKTNEHFYQTMKFTDYKVRFEVCNHPSKGLKSFVRQFTLREDWEDIKLNVMLYGLRYKFSEHNPHLRQKLIWTRNEHIQEGNYWNDKFWGVCLKTGEGENHLGRLLMQVREEIK